MMAKETKQEKETLRILLDLEKQGLVKRIGSKNPRKAKWGGTHLGNAVKKFMEAEQR